MYTLRFFLKQMSGKRSWMSTSRLFQTTRPAYRKNARSPTLVRTVDILPMLFGRLCAGGSSAVPSDADGRVCRHRGDGNGVSRPGVVGVFVVDVVVVVVAGYQDRRRDETVRRTGSVGQRGGWRWIHDEEAVDDYGTSPAADDHRRAAGCATAVRNQRRTLDRDLSFIAVIFSSSFFFDNRTTWVR